MKVYRPFLDVHRLILYDWPIAHHGHAIPVSLQKAVIDILRNLKVARVPLSKDVNTELSPERKRIFDSLQEFEREPLRHLRSGRLPQPDYFEILKQRIHDYREVDIELVKDIDSKLERILRLRERFGKRGGWKLVRDYLKAYDQGADARELSEMEEALKDRLEYCFKKPLLAEYGPATLSIAKGIVSFLPWLGEAMTTAEMLEPIKELGGLLSESVQFFRGQIRRSRE